jgi:hypothetical protein
VYKISPANIVAIVHSVDILWYIKFINPLTPELNPSAQRCLPRYLLGTLIFKGLTARHLCKSFGVKGLLYHWNYTGDRMPQILSRRPHVGRPCCIEWDAFSRLMYFIHLKMFAFHLKYFYNFCVLLLIFSEFLEGNAFYCESDFQSGKMIYIYIQLFIKTILQY